MITIIDYGMGNLRSVSKALEAGGGDVKISSNPGDISRARAIVLPGVGAFCRGMENLRESSLLPAILDAVRKGTPFLGICLGMQLLFTESEEHGSSKGFNIIEGKVKRFSGALKIPHMGWNEVKIEGKGIFKGIPDNSYFYFVHSYYAEPKEKNVVIGTTEYGREFASVINKDNIWGVQFHPEKSGELGLRIMENFCRYVD